MRRLSATLLALLCIAAAPLRSQVIETPVAFDSAGRLRVLTPGLVGRLQLGPPEWPVRGDFDEARLFRTGDAWVLVVKRGEGVERYALTPSERAALGARVSAAAAEQGMPAQDVGTSAVAEESARGAFITGQSLRGFFNYGIPLGVITREAGASVVTGLAAFLISTGVANSSFVSAPMAQLANDLAHRGTAVGLLVGPYGDRSEKALAFTALAASVAGAIVGFNYGRGLTSAEAEAATWGSTTLALTTTGLTLTAAPDGDWPRYVIAGALVIGVPLGLEYPRRVSYVLTPGDLLAARVVQGIGAAAGGSISAASSSSDRGTAALVTAGYLAGVIVGDRLVARRYDYTVSQARLLALGTGLAATAAAQLSNAGSDATRAFVSYTIGAGLGALLTHNLLNIPEARGRTSRARAPERDAFAEHVSFEPSGLLAAAMRSPGMHPVLSIRF